MLLNEMFMFNPRNAYQNYAVATNTSEKIKYTYMGMLLPRMGNATYSTSGELSPLLKDPCLRTIGIGTRIFLGGTQGYVAWNGTQFNTGKPRNSMGIPLSNSATLSVVGDMKKMSPDFIRAAYFEKYGVSLFVGIGIPIPVLDEDMARCVAVGNGEIETTVLDYGVMEHPPIGQVSYRQLQEGHIVVNGRKIRTAPLSSVRVARTIAQRLKEWIGRSEFLLSEPVERFPEVNGLQSLEVREVS